MKKLITALLCALLALGLTMVLAAAEVDILYIVPSAQEIDLEQLGAWLAEGRSVQLACAAKSGDKTLTATLADAGYDGSVLTSTLKEQKPDAAASQVEKNWSDKVMQKALVSFIRTAHPTVIVVGGSGGASEVLAAGMEAALANAADFSFETEDAAEKGVWIPVLATRDAAEAEAALAQDWPSHDDRLRAYCAERYADAQHADPATIPYPETRGEDGYLTEGEFVHEDPDNGLWAYASPTVQVEIVRYEQPEIPRIWYVSHVQFKPESESLHSQTYVNASFKGQMIYPETLAQASQMIFAMNTDYYIYRKDNGGTGNIIRDRQILYNQSRGMGFPNLDTAALHDDGSMTVYNTKETTSTELLALGTVHDALSFGPYLVRDGKLRTYAGSNHDHKEPRSSLGMVAPGHYVVVTVEGRFNKGVGPAGVSLNMLGELLYANGANEAINLDGGNTAVLIFMGKKLNRTASKSGNGTTQPRNMSELLGVGTSGLVHTDMVNAK